MAIRKTRALALCVLMGVIASGCMSNATDEEINQMCNVLVKVKGEVGSSTVNQMVVEANEAVARKEKRLKEWKEKDLGRLDDELFAKSAAATDEKEKEKITEQIVKKKDVIAAKYDSRIAAIPAERDVIVSEAKAKAVANKSAWDKAVKECVEAAQKEGLSQKTAQCRTKAKTPDEYWKNCW